MTFGMSAKRLPSFPAWVCLALLILPWPAGLAAEAPRDLAALMTLLRQDGKVTADFTESRTLTYLTEPVVVEGQLTYSPGGRLERLTTRPKREKMTIEGRLLTIEQNPRDPPIRVLLGDHPPLQAFVEALRALLAGDEAALGAVFDPDYRSDGDDWRLKLTPKAAALAAEIEAIEVAGTAAGIASLEIAERNGNRSLIALRPRP